MSRSVQFITGHFRNDEPLDIDWHKVADPKSTLVIYMGLANLEQICTCLIEAGLPASTPAAAIENGTSVNQQRVISTLDSLPAAISSKGLAAPVMIIIGKVVSLADELDWFQYALEESSYDKNSVAHH
jgi:uroporphyrin-III C-methyltransferase/precorrin-2 dehydrogenase/sirohydrochlorin ferrochelatase/uroporphyrin-III C-methyltransferase